jgi:hypothetical protein
LSRLCGASWSAHRSWTSCARPCKCARRRPRGRSASTVSCNKSRSSRWGAS